MQWKYPNPLLSENPPMGNLVPLPSWQRGLITTVIRTSGEDFGHHMIGTCRLVIVLTAVWLQGRLPEVKTLVKLSKVVTLILPQTCAINLHSH